MFSVCVFLAVGEDRGLAGEDRGPALLKIEGLDVCSLVEQESDITDILSDSQVPYYI